MLIQSLQNKRIIELSKLNKKKYRDLSQTYLVYNDNIIKEAYTSNMLEVIITQDLDYQSEFEVLYVTEQIMNKLCDIIPTPKTIAQVKINKQIEFDCSRVLVIDELQDPGNLGTILRTACALGINNIFLGEGCVDVYNPKVVRSMQGVEFHLNFMYGNVYEYLSTSSLPIVTTFLDEENQVHGPIESFNLVIGNEGRGIDPKIKNLNHLNKKIDIEFESLNVAIATAIILNEIR
jgi:TrmH family RNA methyltransferase